ncbi:MAG: response regulator transcription factor [Phycicoccus sp.]|nr:response regulator transcription factor [Phycicoccus sp.]
MTRGWAGPPEQIRVMVVDDHDLYRRGLCAVVETQPDLVVVGEASSGPAAVKVALATSPDIILMDVRMPGVDGIETCRQLLAEVPTVKVLMLTMSDDEDDLFEALRAGASGYLLKSLNADEVAVAVRAAHNGHAMIPPSMAAEFVGDSSRGRPRQPEAAARLTERELEVLRFVARGAQNREIARELFISENTVKNHVRNILDKLQMHSRVEAAMFAVRSHLIQDPT